MPSFYIQKKTPALNWATIHRGLDLEAAKDWLILIAGNYDLDQYRAYDSSLCEDGLYLSAYESGDLHEFRVLESTD